mmetsp:Transcript_8250/g.20269  ORF Transcript_8250/g.20269 Transcript_8250/m.20269 type:complete len:359 (+) Transcript_8250:309-1385(+)|eukprot:CAMPEP_0114506156 /NCGR_PEP_ID=MMETSP0109-20121206/11266_1 /TAXON_ID=29199 /ORGANISM="Chlorarachnion reptans, Strain CCCM449" /LENGTH=358 /DNA_ID=CAMNT_0001684703 /DNA_START=279 /DNA_END=1355 /DNA_ORIENTATION=-
MDVESEMEAETKSQQMEEILKKEPDLQGFSGSYCFLTLEENVSGSDPFSGHDRLGELMKKYPTAGSRLIEDRERELLEERLVKASCHLEKIKKILGNSSSNIRKLKEALKMTKEECQVPIPVLDGSEKEKVSKSLKGIVAGAEELMKYDGVSPEFLNISMEYSRKICSALNHVEGCLNLLKKPRNGKRRKFKSEFRTESKEIGICGTLEKGIDRGELSQHIKGAEKYLDFCARAKKKFPDLKSISLSIEKKGEHWYYRHFTISLDREYEDSKEARVNIKNTFVQIFKTSVDPEMIRIIGHREGSFEIALVAVVAVLAIVTVWKTLVYLVGKARSYLTSLFEVHRRRQAAQMMFRVDFA